MKNSLLKIFSENKMPTRDEYDDYKAWAAMFRAEPIHWKETPTEICAYFHTKEDAIEWRKANISSPSGDWRIIEETFSPFWSLVVPLLKESMDGPIDEGEDIYEYGLDFDEEVEYALLKVGSHETKESLFQNFLDDYMRLEEWKKERWGVQEASDDVYWPVRNQETDEIEQKIKNQRQSKIQKQIQRLENNIANHEAAVRNFLSKKAKDPNASVVAVNAIYLKELKKIDNKKKKLADLKKMVN